MTVRGIWTSNPAAVMPLPPLWAWTFSLCLQKHFLFSLFRLQPPAVKVIYHLICQTTAVTARQRVQFPSRIMIYSTLFICVWWNCVAVWVAWLITLLIPLAGWFLVHFTHRGQGLRGPLHHKFWTCFNKFQGRKIRVTYRRGAEHNDVFRFSLCQSVDTADERILHREHF